MGVPEELTPEQMAQDISSHQAVPEEISPEEMHQAVSAPPAVKGVAFGAPPVPEEISIEDMKMAQMDARMSGQRGDNTTESYDLMANEPGFLQAANVVPAADDFYSKEHSILENVFYGITIPEQFVARQAVKALEGASLMSSEDARDVLTRDQVHGSDIVNFYWKDPGNIFSKTGRFVVGLAADILLDPLTYIGVGALTETGRTVNIAGKTIDNLGHMSKAQRYGYKTLEAVEKIVTGDGALSHITEGADDVARLNMQAIARERDAQLGFDDLVRNLNVSPNTKEAIIREARVGMEESTWAQEWYEGSRGFTFGARIPFTNIGFEADLPGHFSKMAAIPLMALDGTFGVAKSYLKQIPMLGGAYDMLAGFATKTGKLIFDVQQNTRLASTNKVETILAEYNSRAKSLFAAKQADLGTEKFAEFFGAFVDEMDNGLHTKEAAERMAKDAGLAMDDPQVVRLYTPNQDDLKRMEILAQHPSVQGIIDDQRALLSDMAEQYRLRGLPFNELDVFGKDSARRYLPRQINKKWFDKMAEVRKGSELIEAVSEHMPALAGNIDDAALGRKFRAPLAKYNAESMEKDGLKMFVDDPIELVTQRIKDMSKVIEDHDLMEAAIPYAVKKSQVTAQAKLLAQQLEEGVITRKEYEAAMKNYSLDGYVEFTQEQFKRMTIDKSDQFGPKWDSFVPSYYKTSDKIYLPTDVHNRLDYAINGWATSKPLEKFLNGANAYTTLWRNNALFGPGYIGMNAFSNMLTYLSYNDSGLPAIAKATSLLIPNTMMGRGIEHVAEGSASKMRSLMFETKNHLGEVEHISGEQMLREAAEDNVLGSTFQAKEMQFSDFAEHVASNRKARQELKQKAMTVADHAFLWRYSRGMAQFADEIPKLATYISKREAGYTREAAADLAERYFYNFNNVSKGQDVVRKTLPFSSFPMKTAEMVLQHAKDGRWAGFTMPGKVQAALDGAFVQDHETRNALDEMLPDYNKIAHPIHGELLPGMRELMIDVPWATNTLMSLFHPEKNIHPIAQLIKLAASYNGQSDEEAAENEKSQDHFIASQLDLVLPSYAREAMTLAEINGAIDFGGWFKDRYTPQMPTASQAERALSNRKTGDKGTVFQKFQNAADLGHAFDKQYGENWLYNFLFKGSFDGETGDSYAQDQEAGTRGEFIRQHMRQLSLGLASMTKLDSTFFMHNFAVKRQISLKEQKLKAQIVESGELVDTERITQEKYLKRWADEIPLAKEILALKYKQKAGMEYYDYFLEGEKRFPSVNLIEYITGAGEFKFDYRNKPDKDVYESLYKGKTMNNIPDDEVQDYMDKIQQKEGL